MISWSMGRGLLHGLKRECWGRIIPVQMQCSHGPVARERTHDRDARSLRQLIVRQRQIGQGRVDMEAIYDSLCNG